MTDAVFLERSRAGLARHFPEVTARLERMGALESSLVVADGAAVDIRFGERSIYGGDAHGFATAQVEAYVAKPLRLYMNRPDDAGLLSPVSIRLARTMLHHLETEQYDEISRYPTKCPSFLVVFGLGLGHHLEPLACATEARWLILVEPLVDFFAHASHVVDWQALVATFEARGGGVQIITDLDPTAMTAAITGVMSEHGIPFADGSWVFTHYPLWAFAEARQRLHEALEFAFINRGFFEDELRMVGNAVTNFARRDFRLLEARPRLRRVETAVIVGAGPSLDEGLETLRRIRDRIVLFSCGTALRPLLRAGLVPDFHCELENVPELVEVVTAAGKYGDLSQITLIASATVDPGVPPLFAETIFYFRDSVSSTQIFGRRHRFVPLTAPTCVNMGMAMAAYMGFTDFVLFGTDCGVRPGAKRHAEGTIYRDLGVWSERDRKSRPAIEVEGNFGGVVATDWVYDACRLMLGRAIELYRFNAVNCSDGAVIPGAHPCVPEALRIQSPTVDRALFAAEIKQSLSRYEAGALLADTAFDALAAQTVEMFGRLDAIVEELGCGEADFALAFQRIVDFKTTCGERHGRTEALISGTLLALARVGMFYGFRIADAAARERLYRAFIAEFRRIIAEMADQTRVLFARLAEDEVSASASRRAQGD